LSHGQISPVELHLILVPLETVQVLGLVRVSEHFTFSNFGQITLKKQKREMVFGTIYPKMVKDLTILVFVKN
jgi:hypothetical protein